MLFRSLRGGFAVVYNKTAANNNLTVLGNDAAYASPGNYIPALNLKDGVNVAITPWPNLSPSLFPTTQGSTPGGLGVIDPGVGRPARQAQWSIGVQREIARNIVLETSYVGNRGAWWQAPGLTTYKIGRAHV